MSGPTNPRVVLQLLEQRARRRFGQHFLTDDTLCDRIVRGARVRDGERVVEIGPGLGILTAALVRAGTRVTAVELDRDLASWIRDTWTEVRVHEADAAKVDWAELCPDGGWKVVANLPYNVGTTVLMQLLRRPDVFQSVTVMLQLEVVQRLVASPGVKAYGALSVEAAVRGSPVMLFQVPPGAFHPPPKVKSAVVRFDLFDAPRTGNVPPEVFDRVVRCAFSQRRKMVRNALSAVYGRERAVDALEKAGLETTIRAERISPVKFVALAEALHPEYGAQPEPVAEGDGSSSS